MEADLAGKSTFDVAPDLVEAAREHQGQAGRAGGADGQVSMPQSGGGESAGDARLRHRHGEERGVQHRRACWTRCWRRPARPTRWCWPTAAPRTARGRSRRRTLRRGLRLRVAGCAGQQHLAGPQPGRRRRRAATSSPAWTPGCAWTPDWLAELTGAVGGAQAGERRPTWWAASSRPTRATLFETALGATTLPDLDDVRPGHLPALQPVGGLHQAGLGAGRRLPGVAGLLRGPGLRPAPAGGGLPLRLRAAARWRISGRGPRCAPSFVQYYRYARGDGKADLWRKRHAIRYATYLVALPALAGAGRAWSTRCGGWRWRRGRWPTCGRPIAGCCAGWGPTVRRTGSTRWRWCR